MIIFDDARVRRELLPLTFTRPVGALRVGIDTIADKWRHIISEDYGWAPAADYLSEVFPAKPAEADTLWIAGHILPSEELAKAIKSLNQNEYLTDAAGNIIAWRGEPQLKVASAEPKAIGHLYDIFLLNGEAIEYDFARLTKGRKSVPVSSSNTIIGDPSLVFIEEGAAVEGAFINTRRGPVYIGTGADVMEGSMLRGPIAVCEHATVNMGTKIYSDTTIGPWCKVGGEINNVVMQAYSNKAHDGFLGNAVIGEWCNIGAGCVASNLKNDYTPIKLWNYPTGRFARTGLQFCGLIMGDHSKAGINTMFNTATVLGVGVNIHGSGFPRNFVPSFTEGSTAGYSDVPMAKFFDIARRVMQRRGLSLTPELERMFEAIRSSEP